MRTVLCELQNEGGDGNDRLEIVVKGLVQCDGSEFLPAGSCELWALLVIVSWSHQRQLLSIENRLTWLHSDTLTPPAPQPVLLHQPVPECLQIDVSQVSTGQTFNT